ncbi:influenza virus NS1A-binding protein-like isoform X2 [Bradysia coprophila]|uniref:influenza virus NS1A-binding protein-like isoform X2 n=1 Tax=Bradysia coprophila TaxID=38358 RepID=UPI00187DA000|nr:influenza virus NS1A-binding protein-like isoform X2 [Bradysia coprophila]
MKFYDYYSDDAMEDCGFLKFTDEKLKSSFLQALSTMQKHRLFCDVVLNVDNSDIHAHKNVLACVSPHLMELFSSEQSTQHRQSDGIPSYRLNGGLTKNALQIIVDYAYTATLEIPDVLVQEVYLAAWKLRIDNIVRECARHLIEELCADSCIETRSLPGINKNKAFALAVDSFISKEFTAVSRTAGFLQLPCANIDVLYQTKQEMSVVTNIPLCRLVLDWVKRQLSEETLSMNHLLERAHLLYLALDNSLQDCSDLPPGHESESDLVQDYKRLVLKCPNNKGRRKCLAAPVRPRVLIYSRDIGENEFSVEPDWNIIGSANVGENSFIALAMLNGQLTRISIQLRLNLPPTTPSPVHIPDSMSLSSHSTDSELDKPELFLEVAAMSAPKCGLGVADWEGKLLVCGGYDRGECLKSVESYDPETNTFTKEPSMLEARGRVQIAVLNGCVYAVGGSNGTTELDTVECLPPNSRKWLKRCKLPMARSNAGVCMLNGNIYCIGGWNGQSGIKQCDVYNPAEDNWTQISPLLIGRYQSGVTSFKQQLWAAGGSDAWNCLGSVETFNPEANQWTMAPSLLTPRRGCGLAEFNGKLYAVGGSDGTHSLNSTEIYDEESKTWIVGPSLTTARSNVSCVTVNGKLYAIGGFAGKFFLNTMEYLDSKTNEWTTFVPHINQIDGLTDLHFSDSSDNLTNGDEHVNGHEPRTNGVAEPKEKCLDEVFSDQVEPCDATKFEHNNVTNTNGHKVNES